MTSKYLDKFIILLAIIVMFAIGYDYELAHAQTYDLEIDHAAWRHGGGYMGNVTTITVPPAGAPALNDMFYVVGVRDTLAYCSGNRTLFIGGGLKIYDYNGPNWYVNGHVPVGYWRDASCLDRSQEIANHRDNLYGESIHFGARRGNQANRWLAGYMRQGATYTIDNYIWIDRGSWGTVYTTANIENATYNSYTFEGIEFSNNRYYDTSFNDINWCWDNWNVIVSTSPHNPTIESSIQSDFINGFSWNCNTSSWSTLIWDNHETRHKLF